MNILALETSTEACSVALLTHTGQQFSEFEITPRQHTRFLPSMMDAVLGNAKISKQDLTHIAYASGPGAFTGVRIAASTAQGISIGLNIPMLAISTLAVLAQQTFITHRAESILASLDARMNEAYVAAYRVDPVSRLVELEGAETLVRLDQIGARQINGVDHFLAGSGFRAAREAGFLPHTQNIDEQIMPHAAALAELAKQAIRQGMAFAADRIQINYIRNKVAEKKQQLKA